MQASKAKLETFTVISIKIMKRYLWPFHYFGQLMTVDMPLQWNNVQVGVVALIIIFATS